MNEEMYLKYNKVISIEAGDFIIDIDELIVDTIILLNRKGYRTVNCCQGHPTGDEYCNSYISFRESYEMPMPSGYVVESHTPLVIRKMFRCRKNKQQLQQKLILENANELYKWVENLPILRKDI